MKQINMLQKVNYTEFEDSIVWPAPRFNQVVVVEKNEDFFLPIEQSRCYFSHSAAKAEELSRENLILINTTYS